MRTSIATLAIFIASALAASTSLCTNLAGDLVNACGGEGTKDFGKNVSFAVLALLPLRSMIFSEADAGSPLPSKSPIC